jgi:nucleotide-binding universal stress UspA family protein
MTYRTLLLQMFEDPNLDHRLATAVALARRFQAHLVGLTVAPPPVMPFGYGEAAAYVGPEIFEAQREANHAIAERLHAAFDRALEGTGLSSIWRDEEGDAASLYARAAATVDLVVTGQESGDMLDAMVPSVTEYLVTEAGGPVLMLPSAADDGDFGKRVMLGWNGSKEAKRALVDSLPFLKSADTVWLATVGDAENVRLDRAQRMLGRHDVAARELVLEDKGQEAGAMLLEQAQANDADLLVMGAYGRSRLREMILGGATRHVLHNATMPVLFSG